MHRLPTRFALTLFVLAAPVIGPVACGDDLSTGVAATPARLVPLSPATDTVATGEESDPPLSVRVESSLGEPVEGIPVRFILTSGEGDLFPNLAVSDADGVAEATFVGGSLPGESVIRTDIPNYGNVAGLQFEVVTEPADSVAIEKLGGDGQLAEVASQLALPFEVRTTLPSGGAAGGIAVAWRVASQGGAGAALTADTTLTDEDGKAEVLLTLGVQAREYTVEAYAARGVASDTVRFQATASATFTGAVRLDSVRPAPLISGGEATLYGTGFLPDVESMEVRVEGEPAEVIEATATLLRITLPSFGDRCVPAREVGVRALAGEDASNGLMVRLLPEQAPLDLSVGDVRSVAGSEAVTCLQLEGGDEPREYQILVQSATIAPQATTAMRLVTRVGVEEVGRAATVLPEPDFDPGLRQAASPFIRPELSLRLSARQELVRRGVAPARVPRDSLERAALRAAVPSVGDTVRYFFATGGDYVAECSATDVEISGVVRAVRDDALLIEDVQAPAGGFTAEEWSQLADEFQSVIFPTDTAYFGSPSDIDGNGRVVLVFSPEVNRLTPAGSEAAIGGFFLPLDLAASGRGGGGMPGPGGEVCPASNEAELLYLVVADPEGEFGDPVTHGQALRNARGISAHELQHLIATERRVIQRGGTFENLEDAWLAEGLSHLAEEVVGLRMDELGLRANLSYEQVTNSREALDLFNSYHIGNFFQLSLYMFAPDMAPALSTTDPGGLEGLQMRGFGWLFLRWLADQEGGGDERQLIRRLVDGGPNGWTGVENVEAATGRTWDRLLAEFAAALPLDDAGVEGVAPRYQVLSWNFRDIFARLNENPAARNRFFAPFPLSVTSLPFETSAVQFDVKASTARYFALGGELSSPAVSLSLQTPRGEVLEESSRPQITIVRTR